MHVKYLLMPYETGWQVVDGGNGRRVGLFLVKSDAAAWLKSFGLVHTDNSAGESQAEIWTREEW